MCEDIQNYMVSLCKIIYSDQKVDVHSVILSFPFLYIIKPQHDLLQSGTLCKDTAGIYHHIQMDEMKESVFMFCPASVVLCLR